MSINLIAMLVSLAMMLTGVGGAVQSQAALPATETARTVTLSNVSVSWNGETLRLAPQAHIGVSTDGAKALYDFAVDLEDRKLFPIQLSVGEAGITALSGNGGIAVKVTAQALEGLAAQLEEQVNASMAEAGNDNSQLMQFITEEYMPAYTGVLQLAMDPEQRQRINGAVQAVFDRVVDRGAGTPTELEVEGVSYDVTAYSYSLDAMQMAALSDAVYTEVPELNEYYSTLFKLYGMLPEESGLRGLDSFTALFGRFGVQMRMDVEEQRSDDGAVDQMDSVLTIDVSSMMNVPQGTAAPGADQENAQPSAETDDVPSKAEGAVPAAAPEATEESGTQLAGAPLKAEGAAPATAPEATEESGIQLAGEPLEAAAGNAAQADDGNRSTIIVNAVPEAAEAEGTEEGEAANAVPEAAEAEGAEEGEAANAVPEAEEAEGAEEGEAADAVPEAAEADGSETLQATVDAPETPGPAPVVMNLHSLKMPEYTESNGNVTYALDEHHGIDVTIAANEGEGVHELEMKVILTEDGNKTQGGKLSVFMAHDEMGTNSYSMSMKAIQQDTAKVDAAFYGVGYPDGTSENSAVFELHTGETNAALSFDLNVTAQAIEDAAGAAEPTCVIDDLSREGLQALSQDPAVMGTLMQAAGMMLADVNTLKADPSMKNFEALMRGEGLPIDVDELDEEDFDIDIDFDEPVEESNGDYGLVLGDDGNYELVVGEGDETAFDYDEEPVEDDGVLAFAQPRLTWLPSGWGVTTVETDTAYDWVQMTVCDASGAECAYAIFFLDPEAGTANYIVEGNGKVVDGRMMNVTDFGEGGLSVTVSENGMYGNLMFNSEAIELDTIGKIVAGIEF